MRRPLPNDWTDLRRRLGDLERRLGLLEQSPPRLRLVTDDGPPEGVAPSWPHLPRRLPAPHALLIGVFRPAWGEAAYRLSAEEGTRVLNRVA